MIIYGNNCNSGSIHRNEQPVYSPDAIEPDARKGRPVLCVESKQKFANAHAAAEAFMVTPEAIRSAANPKQKSCKTAAGVHWRYI